VSRTVVCPVKAVVFSRNRKEHGRSRKSASQSKTSRLPRLAEKNAAAKKAIAISSARPNSKQEAVVGWLRQPAGVTIAD